MRDRVEIIAGVCGGIVSGLGLGGGTVVILILSMFLGVEQHMAQAANIIFFVPAASLSIILNLKNKIIKWKTAIPIIVLGVVGAIIGAKISINLDTGILKKCFGVFIGLVALYEIFYLFKEYKKKKKSNNN